MGPRAKYLAAAAVALSLSGCGGSGAFNPDASRPQTRFAVAQEVESRAAARFGAAEGLDALSTICISSTESNTSWTCTSNYAPSDGTITSLQQMAAVTRVTYDSGMHTFVLASDEAQTGSPGLTGTVPLSTIAKVVKTDGSSTGEPPATGPGFVATSTTRSQMSESSLSTMAALLSPARKSALLKAVALLNGTPPANHSGTNLSTPPPVSTGSSSPTQGTSTNSSPSTGTKQGWVESPSKNIVCQLSVGDPASTFVVCQSTTPPQQANLTGAGKLTQCSGARCLGDSGDSIPRILPYGHSVSVGTFTCASKTTGMECVTAASDSGFVIARAGIQPVHGITAAGGVCGTVTGGPDDYAGAALTVTASQGVTCSTAMQVITDLSSGKGQNHQGGECPRNCVGLSERDRHAYENEKSEEQDR